MAVIRHLRLVDGPLMPRGELVQRGPQIWKERHVREMAAVLVAQNAFADRDDAVRVLRAANYEPFDIFAMLDDVMMIAQLETVAAEMAAS